ncbi:hypothetical protein TWF106_000832 [Orbilia oligospora]|uniref:Extracellular membrane protein CFEM domain-containing protein n=1 Tax=Orbilia oligospora TaxID=2813651 RepID=A0A7C8URR6_ORBOL|nr:hypothetical protein TWF788_005981 [Orbilia oligospora]KAF3226335.1 hypothetical protein TWF106_000832 [Orbilia oligospora]
MYRGITLLLLARLAMGQDITSAPALPQTSRVSITSALEYTLQRSCVAHCLYYNGPLPRGPYYHDWDDVGGELKCGYAPINGCYCNTKYASSATAYFNTCIPYYCGSGEDADPDDLVSALSLYNDYCATANGNPTKPVPTPVVIPASTTSAPASSETSETGSSSTSVDESSQPATTGSSAGSSGAAPPTAVAESKTNPSPTEAGSEMGSGGGNGNGGLSKGATIGIAVGASVGGLALIAAAVVLFLTRRRALAGEKQPMGGIEG